MYALDWEKIVIRLFHFDAQLSFVSQKGFFSAQTAEVSDSQEQLSHSLYHITSSIQELQKRWGPKVPME